MFNKAANTNTWRLSSVPPRSSYHAAHENGAPRLQDAEAAVVPEPRSRSDGGEPRPAHRAAVRERGAVRARKHEHRLKQMRWDERTSRDRFSTLY